MCLVVVGKSDRAQGQAQRALFEARKAGVNCLTFTAVGPYPTADGIDEARAMARRVGASVIAGVGSGGVIDLAKATALLHGSSGSCKNFLMSPSAQLMAGGGHTTRKGPEEGSLPFVAVPTSVGAGASTSERCLIWHPDDELLVPMAAAGEKALATPSAVLVDPELGMTLNVVERVAMGMTALLICMDALLAWSMAGVRGTEIGGEDHQLFSMGVKGITAIGKGISATLADHTDKSALENLAMASLCAGRLSSITPSPASQLIAQAAGSLLGRHCYPEVCAVVIPHVVQALLLKISSGDAEQEELDAIAQALGTAASTLLGNPLAEGEDLLSWLDEHRQHLRTKALSALDPDLTAKEVANNADLLLTLEDPRMASVWGTGEVEILAERAITG
ncbi:unnamed protein product [Discosporangium mesarthrocarpum]